MKIGSVLGWGIVIYAVVHLVWTGTLIHAIDGVLISRILVIAALCITTVLATRALNLHTERDILPHAIGWVIVIAVLDAFFTVPFTGWGLYTDWNVWVGYLLVLFIPIMTTAARRHGSA
jgi:hypothetical protein